MKSILIKDTTREERIRIVEESLSACGASRRDCNACSVMGGGVPEAIYQPYIDGEKEIFEINEEAACGVVRG